MAKLKKGLKAINKGLRTQVMIVTVAFLFVSIFAVAGVSLAGADNEFNWRNVEEVAGHDIAASVVESAEEDVMLGAVGSSEHLGSMVCSSDSCTYTASAPLKDATTTLFSVADPFKRTTSTASDVVIDQITSRYGLTGATSTVELVRIATDGTATTTYSIGCSSAPTQYATSTSGNVILQTGVITTSSPNYVLENNLGTTAVSGALIATDTVAKILLDATNPYLVCTATTWAQQGDDTGFTSNNNTFSGQYAVKISRPRF